MNDRAEYEKKTGHRLARKCSKDDPDCQCGICQGALDYCEICHEGEAGLAEKCPGCPTCGGTGDDDPGPGKHRCMCQAGKSTEPQNVSACGAGAGIPCHEVRLRAVPVPGLEVGRALIDILGSLRLNLTHSPWSRSRGVVGWVMRLVSEATETLMTLETDKFGNRPTEMLVDPTHLRAELGDVFWCWATTVYAAEDAGLFKMEDVLREAEAKLRRRKPWIFDAALPQPNTPEEEHKMTLANKAKEPKS